MCNLYAREKSIEIISLVHFILNKAKIGPLLPFHFEYLNIKSKFVQYQQFLWNFSNVKIIFEMFLIYTGEIYFNNIMPLLAKFQHRNIFAIFHNNEIFAQYLAYIMFPTKVEFSCFSITLIESNMHWGITYKWKDKIEKNTRQIVKYEHENEKHSNIHILNLTSKIEKQKWCYFSVYNIFCNLYERKKKLHFIKLNSIHPKYMRNLNSSLTVIFKWFLYWKNLQ